MPPLESKTLWRPWLRWYPSFTVYLPCETDPCCDHVATCFAEVSPGVFMWLCKACADELEQMTHEECLALSTAQNRRIS